jgi:hypothetical protein
MVNPSTIIRATAARFLFALLLTVPFFWLNSVLLNVPIWNVVLISASVVGCIHDTQWRRVAALQSISLLVWRVMIFAILMTIPIIITGHVLPGDAPLHAVYLITLSILFGLSLLYQQPNAAAKIASIMFGLMMALIMTEIGAGIILNRLEHPVVKTADQAKQQSQAAQPTSTALPPSATLLPVTPTATITPTIGPSPTPAPTATPEPPRPIAGIGYLDFSVDNGEPEWGPLTGYGPRINSVARAYMYDNNGKLVYDNHITFNGKGYRGPEIPYDKPHDVYRILLIGDSFVEAVQVDYPDTFGALLQTELAKHNTDKRKFEVVAQGRYGWGTLQEYLYYVNEGYKYHADLVILSFYINDVADNDPAFFYPNINNTNFDYSFDGDTVKIVDTNKQVLPPRIGRKLYNALPQMLQGTNIARLAVRLSDPPPQVVTPGGVLTRVHPQFYIFVKSPPIEGYDEAWRRTTWGLTHFAQAVQKNGGKFAVMPIFIGSEMVKNVSNWFPDLVKGWQWDDTLPDQKLNAALSGQPATIIPTRPRYESYAKEMGSEVYKLIFLPEDGHFNKLGHQLTADVLYQWLISQGVISAP